MKAHSIRGYCCATTLILVGLGFVTTAVAEGDPVKGKEEAWLCIGCHGSQGQGSPGTPALAARPQAELAGLVKAYRDGTKEHMLMSRVAKKLTDDQITNITAYFESLPKPQLQ